MNISPNSLHIQRSNLAKDVKNASLANVKTFARSSHNIKSKETEEKSNDSLDRSELGKGSPSETWLGKWRKPLGGKSTSAETISAEKEKGDSASVDGQASEPSYQDMKAANQLENKRQEALASMMAEDVKTQENIAKIYSEMWAEVEKSRAARHQILMETMRSVSEIIFKCHTDRAAASDAHFKAVLEAIVDAPSK